MKYIRHIESFKGVFEKESLWDMAHLENDIIDFTKSSLYYILDEFKISTSMNDNILKVQLFKEATIGFREFKYSDIVDDIVPYLEMAKLKFGKNISIKIVTSINRREYDTFMNFTLDEILNNSSGIPDYIIGINVISSPKNNMKFTQVITFSIEFSG